MEELETSLYIVPIDRPVATDLDLRDKMASECKFKEGLPNNV